MEIPMASMGRTLTLLYGKEPPKGVVQAAIDHVKEDEDDDLFHISDFNDFVRNHIASGREEALQKMNEVKEKLMNAGKDRAGSIFFAEKQGKRMPKMPAGTGAGQNSTDVGGPDYEQKYPAGK